MRARTWLSLAACLILASSCARMRPPPGGPVDKVPPEIVGSWPEDGSGEHGSLDTITLRFSEKVDRTSFLSQLRTDPDWLLRSLRWEADTLVALRFWDPFPLDTTVAVYLLPGWRDRHRVQQPEWQMVHFATGDSLMPGWLAGKATFKGNPSRAMRLELADSMGHVARELRPDRQGGFAFRHLPTDGRRLTLRAWQDVDGDSLYDAAIDFADSLSDSLLILTAPEPQRLDLLLDVIDPNEPGEVLGSFTCLDTLPAAYRLHLFPDSLRIAPDSLPARDPALLPDSLRRALIPGDDGPALWLPTDGEFTFDAVPPGPWWLFVFKDLAADSVWDPTAEPAYLDPGPQWLEPGGKITWMRFGFPEPTDSTRAGRSEIPRGSEEGAP